MRLDRRALGLNLPLRNLPLPLLAAVAGLVAYGAVYVTSAAGPGRTGLATKHLLWASLGTCAFLAVYSIDFRLYIKAAPLLYGAGMVALMAVLFTSPVKGARSWFSLPGGVKVQPSEFMKLAYILLMTWYLSAAPEPLRVRDLAAALAITLLPVGMILLQPDMGTAMTFMPVVIAAVFVAGARLWQLGFLGAGGLGAAMLMWLKIMRVYQKARIYAWLDPEKYKLGRAYQLIQSQIAVGSGGLWGKGLGMGTQNQFDLLPLKESDFIFAVIAEEGGFLRASVLLVLLVLLVLAGTMIAMRARERRGQILASCATALLGGQALINIGVTLGLLPTTGITLPFVSYGGSSMITSFMAVGLLANIHARPRERGLFG
ncbi:MAG: rod shape-determining protein RodA [Planctomycetota bacterium]|jgi:rod shape determining protein RodA